jgi:hypothetical protein
MSRKTQRLAVLFLALALSAWGVTPALAVPERGPKHEVSDHDGDHDSDPSTAHEDDHSTSDEGDNAHPSGKDRSVENGGSGNQGKAESNPDDSKGPQRYEGAKGDDKSQGPGGTDTDDQDGNNGCGQDDDFDDDNNGWCGKPAATTTPDDDGDDVGGDDTERCPGADDMVQGRSCSIPDQDGRGPERDETGTDMDEDGNNGCGNDSDGMDDNEGWCGPKGDDDTEVLPDLTERPGRPAQPCDADATRPGTQPCHGVAPDVVTNPSTPDDEVLGEIITRDNGGPAVAPAAIAPAVEAEGAALPFTGGQILSMVAAGFGLITAGGTALVIRNKK